MTSIPASELVNVIPSVLQASGNPLSLNAVMLTQDTSIQIGEVRSFATLEDVQDWFGPSSVEAGLAAVYFDGYEGATVLPGLLYFMQYNVGAVGAFLRGGSMAGLTLAQLQALSGQLTIVVNGVSSLSAAINLAAAASFSNAAALIQTGIQAGTPASTATCVYDPLRQAFVVRSSTTGPASTIGFASGTLSAGLKLTSAAGAVTSQGAAAATPADQLAALVADTQNWVCVMTTWEPITADKVLFAQAVDSFGQRFAYVGWDTSVGPTLDVDPTSFAALTATLNGRVADWGPADKAAHICGITASIDFARTNGRLTYAYKSQSALAADVDDATVAANLIANGYNFYGAYGTANDDFKFLQRGVISGDWGYIDSYINQIKLNSDLQLALLTLLASTPSIPYSTRGYDLIRAACADPINAALNFGSIVPGVTLTSLQRAQVNTAANADIAGVLQTRGWYLKIDDASGAARAARTSPPMTLWYMDGGSIQELTLASIAVL